MARHLVFLVALVLGAALALGCDDGGGGGNSQGKLLDSTHGSYGADPRCLGCHTPDDHNQGLAPYQCVECHGNNGATPGHERPTTPCGSCHNPAPHGTDGFPDPESCQTCHAS
jgi:hypothetical protein